MWGALCCPGGLIRNVEGGRPTLIQMFQQASGFFDKSSSMKSMQSAAPEMFCLAI